MFPDVLSTAIADISPIDQNIAAKRGFFTDLPCLSGRPVLFAWWCALANAFKADDLVRAGKLIEAARTATVRGKDEEQ